MRGTAEEVTLAQVKHMEDAKSLASYEEHGFAVGVAFPLAMIKEELAKAEDVTDQGLSDQEKHRAARVSASTRSVLILCGEGLPRK